MANVGVQSVHLFVYKAGVSTFHIEVPSFPVVMGEPSQSDVRLQLKLWDTLSEEILSLFFCCINLNFKVQKIP